MTLAQEEALRRESRRVGEEAEERRRHPQAWWIDRAEEQQ
jgi:hypothetical protein